MAGASSTTAAFARELLKQQQQEVQRRLDAYREKPDDVQNWETVRSRLWSRLG